MPTPNLVWVRVDERLIHGQGQLWIKSLNCNLVLCVNDAASQNDFQQQLMNVCIPSGIGVRYFSVEKTINVIHKASPTQSIFMCVQTIKDLLTLVEGGVKISEVNLGNIHNGPNKEKITRAIYLSNEEKDMLRKLVSLGVKFNTKTSPGGFDTAKDVDIERYLEKNKEKR